MNEYGIVMIGQDGRTSIVLLGSMGAVREYQRERASVLAGQYLWYVVRVLERSQAEHAAAHELLRGGGQGV